LLRDLQFKRKRSERLHNLAFPGGCAPDLPPAQGTSATDILVDGWLDL